ncbi:MAG: hypothetical protein ACTHN0_03310 [Aquihabitans sp.]
MTGHEELTRRLRSLGTQPVPPAVEQACLDQIERGRRRGPGRPSKLAVAAMVAVVIATSGLAAAGALPGPAQRAAHRALGVVGIDVPDETDGRDPFVDPTAGATSSVPSPGSTSKGTAPSGQRDGSDSTSSTTSTTSTTTTAATGSTTTSAAAGSATTSTRPVNGAVPATPAVPANPGAGTPATPATPANPVDPTTPAVTRPVSSGTQPTHPTHPTKPTHPQPGKPASGGGA